MTKLWHLLVSDHRLVLFSRAIGVMLAAIFAGCTGQTNMKCIFGRCSISPDGSEVVVNVMSGPYLAPGVACDIFSIKTNGSAVTQLTNGPAVKYSPWYSSDGNSIVYISASENGGSQICSMDRNGLNSRLLTFNKLNSELPSYSPDGTKIILAVAATHRPYSMGGMIWTDWDIWDMDADGSSPRQLTFQKYYNVDAPYFSPDGKHVLFSADLNTGSKTKLYHSILVFDVLKDGSAGEVTPMPLPPASSNGNIAFDGDPSFSADGSMIVFTSLRANSYTPFAYQLWTAAIDGTTLRQITRNRSRMLDPIFSPDNKFIYYSENGGLWRMESNGSNPKRLFP